MKKLRLLALLLIATVPFAACDDDDDGTGSGTVSATVSGTVTVEGNGQPGVQVTLSGNGVTETRITSSSGAYSFGVTRTGTYNVALSSIPAEVSFGTTSGTVTVSADGTQTVNFDGSYIRTASISGNVTSGGQGLQDVTVSLSGPQAANPQTTNAQGAYSFSGLRAGNYSVTVSNVPSNVEISPSSKSVQLAVGEVRVVDFSGQGTTPAQVSIRSITTGNTATPVNPAAVVGQIDITVEIDEGDDDVTSVSLLVDGDVVASQNYGAAAAADDAAEASATFTWVTSLNTAAFNGTTGEVTYLNGAHNISASITTVNGGTASATTTTSLTFANRDLIVAQVTGSNGTAVSDQGASAGNVFFGGAANVNIIPVLYSGKTLQSVNVSYVRDPAGANVTVGTNTATGPFPATTTFSNTGAGVLNGYHSTVLNADIIRLTGPLYADGTSWGAANPAVGLPILASGANGFSFNWDNVAPPVVVYNLTDQVNGATHPACCANNWVNADYALNAGLAAFADAVVTIPGVGGVVATTHEGAASLSQAAIAALPAISTPEESGLGVSLVNTAFEPVVVLTDALGNATRIGLTAAGANPLATTVGHDFAPPTGQAAVDPDGAGAGVIWKNQALMNASSPQTPAADGLAFTATEDRAGFSGTPLRMTLKRIDNTANANNAAGALYPVGAHFVNGGFVNEAATLTRCGAAAPANGAPCLPGLDAGAGATSQVEAMWILTAHLVDQAGNEVETDIVYRWWLDVTAPTNGNTAIPPTLTGGAPTVFSAPVADNLHLWESFFAFDFGNLGSFIPFSDAVDVGDGDRWDENLVASGSAVATVDFVRSLQVGPGGAQASATNVQVSTTDAAGNTSTPNANNFVAGSVPAAGPTFGAGGMGTWAVSAPGAAVNLCNTQGATACNTAGGNVRSLTLTAQAQGPSGTYPNPFASGTVFFYIVTDANATVYNDGAGAEVWTLVGSTDGSGATFTDTGAGATGRTYSWSITLNDEDVATIPNGTNINIAAVGANGSGDAVATAAYNTNVTVVDGT